MNKWFNALLRWLSGTPHRTFIVYPAAVLAFETVHRKSVAPGRPAFVLLLPWGYLQYYLTGKFRAARHAGSRGMERPPDRLITDGPYAFSRNPMYLGHLIFLLGLALAWRSRLAWVLFACCLPWFHLRVLRDEERLAIKFGASYRDYHDRVRRWIPFIF